MRLTVLQYIGIVILSIIFAIVSEYFKHNPYCQLIAIIAMGIYYCYIKE
jgi:uncharacterized membrane protein YjjB (DUF3815 family)